MFSKQHYINWISFTAIICINQIFLVKYLSRFTDYFIAGSLIFTFIYFAILYFNKNIDSESSIKDKKYYYILTIIFLALLSFLVFLIPESPNVNRINAIKVWLENLNDGIYPYLSRENPSSFPFLFILVLPLYYLSVLDILSVIGIGIFLFITIRYSLSKKEIFTRTALICLALPFYYEVIVRSELTFNIGILILLTFLTYKFVAAEKLNGTFYLFSIIWGLALSTRMIAFAVLLIFLLFHFRQRLFNLYLFGSLAVLIFFLTNLPFFLWYPELFILDGPFAVQSTYMPFSIGMVFIIIMIITGWTLANLQELFFTTGIILLLLSSVSFIIAVLQFGFENVLFNSYFDIAYFIFSIPFFILSIKESRVDKYLGKVLV